jgi:hypothetical protein
MNRRIRRNLSDLREPGQEVVQSGRDRVHEEQKPIVVR